MSTGNKAWSGNALFDIYGDRMELTLLGSEEFPVRYALTPDDVYDLATAAFLATALALEEAPAMPMTVKYIEDVLTEIKRFERAAEDAKLTILTDTNGSRTQTLSVGSRHTGALRRASLDLTRALSELRRPR